MSKFVDVEPIIAGLKEMSSEATYDALEYERRSCYGTVAEMLEEAPAADVTPVKRGQWEPLSETQESNPSALAMYRCSACGRKSLQHRMGDNYCSQCGAKMEQSKGFTCYPFCGDNA